MSVTSDIKYIGVNDHAIDLFEGMYEVPNGMAYNSYVILDDKIAVLDTVDADFTYQWLYNIQKEIGNRKPDYLIVQHMEPDHSANIIHFINAYPEITIVASAMAFKMMKNYFGTEFEEKRIVVGEGDKLFLGKHILQFVTAPMVHWPEVIMTYDETEKVLFSADAFGKFGALDMENEWINEARRYYFGIVGKFGAQVQNLLEKLKNVEIQRICPLHGPVLAENIPYYLKAYHTWSSYEPEEDGILIVYTSVYGNTKKAVALLKEKLKEQGKLKVRAIELGNNDKSFAVAAAFRYPILILATTTYNGDVFPAMREFINCLTERNFSNRTVAFIENGSWATMATKRMKEKLEKCKGLKFLDTSVKIASVLREESIAQIDTMISELRKEE